MAGGYEAYEERPRRRRGGRVLVVLLVLLLVLIGLLAVADRVAAGYAERRIADQVQQELTKQDVQSSAPDVAVGGFPFLTQVVGGQYEKISIRLRDVRGPAESSVSLPRLDVDAHDVRASLDTLRSGQGDVVAGTVDGTALVSYATVTSLVNKPGLSLAEQNGKLMVTAPLEILGQQITVKGAAELTVNKGEVLIGFDDLTASGIPDIPAARTLLDAYARQISIKLPLPELPFNLVLKQVRATPDGLVVTGTAKNVALNSVA